jgi:SAM-dependent methyltransferase
MGMEIDRRVMSRYESSDEDARLWQPGRGDLIRLRSWDIFDRFLPRSGRVLDVGGGPGTHAAHLAANGYDVTLVDPVPRHVERASQRAQARNGGCFDVCLGVAADLPAGEESIDVVLLMGPLYHLVEQVDRLAALADARRVLRPGGRLLAEVISRHAWVMDATVKGLLAAPGMLADLERSVDVGLSQDPATVADGSFWAYFHRPDELRDELAAAGFGEIELVAVEGYAWLLGDLDARMTDPGPLLQAVRLTESEPSMLGCSAHVIGIASRP